MGGGGNPNSLKTVEIWSGGPNWIEGTGDTLLPDGRHSFATTIYNNQIYTIGGYDNSSGHYSNIIQSWNGNNWNQVISIPSLQSELLGSVASSYNGSLYIIGGSDMTTKTAVNIVSIWNGSYWSTGTPMPTPRISFGIVEYNNMIYVMGGSNGNTLQTQFYSIIEIYNPATNQWQ